MVLGTQRDATARVAPGGAPVLVLSLQRRDYQAALLATVAAAALSRVPALAALPAASRALALASLKHQARPPGSKLFAQGDVESSLYVVGSGHVQLVKPEPAGSNPTF
eukprot:CAMPEP_0197602012 /NCGR_PEP_ID=MMETSP1326-20131121/36352_1 /TAXON_ID=1155430 /ORGANISM="Genus nov. species nov., Strain RCC2288" /LENGTH=107 /DNA_ID=CAMNT_0043169299 /DNA_START=23 /DNA_END=343 /DNA_ORIENTATION=-